MLVVHVQIRVKPEAIEAFKAATLLNAAGSLREPGVLRFDVVQDESDPTRFVLVEVFRDDQAPLLHKDTPHYLAWREAVDSLMAETRTSRKFRPLHPDANGWPTAGAGK